MLPPENLVLELRSEPSELSLKHLVCPARADVQKLVECVPWPNGFASADSLTKGSQAALCAFMVHCGSITPMHIMLVQFDDRFRLNLVPA